MEKTRLYLVILFFIFGFLMVTGIISGIDTLFWIFFLLMLGSLATLIFYNSNSKIDLINKFIKETDRFILENKTIVSKSSYSDTNLSRIVFDHENKKLIIFKNERTPTSLPYSSLIESELTENGNTLTKSSRGEQVAGAVIGGALAGGAGAIIGGLSGKKTSSDIIKTLQIKITVNDLNSPVHSFYVKDSSNEYTKDSPIYNQLYDSAYEIHKIISLIIKNQDDKLNTVM
ncbi:hypothetical protein P4597_26985 [Peribacillus simplex]|uniref:hypothetical protein n=1 Tax=Peribacillus simplex TaxID=1478 RepID=UPI002E200ECE|nr:hypothetical protein [Peribacillus simplex]